MIIHTRVNYILYDLDTLPSRDGIHIFDYNSKLVSNAAFLSAQGIPFMLTRT